MVSSAAIATTRINPIWATVSTRGQTRCSVVRFVSSVVSSHATQIIPAMIMSHAECVIVLLFEYELDRTTMAATKARS
jgi:hypothetical protein